MGSRRRRTPGCDVYRPVSAGAERRFPGRVVLGAGSRKLNRSDRMFSKRSSHRPGEADLSLKGTIESTQYTSRMYTYCLSLVGIYLWLFGLPSGTASNQLILHLKLVDNATDQIIWESRYKKSARSTSWIYALNSDFFYDTMLKEIMKEVIVSLKKSLN